jgi:hypothetical protein
MTGQRLVCWCPVVLQLWRLFEWQPQPYSLLIAPCPPLPPSPLVRRFDRKPEPVQGLTLPAGTTAASALDRVLRLPGVGSKRFLTTKVDRSVTGLIAQQQCCGPLQLPMSDVAVMAQSHFGHTGSATSIGEQPLKVGGWVLGVWRDGRLRGWAGGG